jgi:hypothetical protein
MTLAADSAKSKRRKAMAVFLNHRSGARLFIFAVPIDLDQ